MNANKTNPPPPGKRWTIAEAQPLRPTSKEFLEKARSATHSTVAQLDLVEQPSEELVPFAEAIPSNHSNGRTDPYLKRCLGLLSFKKKRMIFLTEDQDTEEWRDARKDAQDSKDPNYLNLLNALNHPVAVVPLLDSQDSGIASICFDHPASKKDVEQTTDLTAALSRAVENAINSLYARHKPGWPDELVLQSADIISTSRFPTDAVQEAIALAHAECAALWLLHRPTREWHLASLATRLPVLPGDLLEYRVAADQGIRGHVLQTEQPEYCPDTRAPGSRWYPCVSGIRSCYTIPLFYREKLFAVLCVDSYRLDAFDEKVREALDLFARLLGALVGNAFRQSRERVENRYGPELIRAVNRDELCRRTVDVVRELVEADSASLFLFPEGRGPSFIQLAATTGLAPESSPDQTYQLGEGITGWVAAKRVPLRLRNCGDENELKRWDKEELRWKGKTREIASRRGFERPLLVVPVLDEEDTCLGVIRASGKRHGSEFRVEDCIALEWCAAVLGQELVSIKASGQHPVPSDDPRAYLRAILKKSVEKSRATAGTIDLVMKEERGGKSFLINVGQIGPLIVPVEQLTRSLAQNSVAVLCANTGLVQSVADVSHADWKEIYQHCFEGTKSELALPVLREGKVLAVINLESTEIGHFTPKYRARAEKYARLVAQYLAAHPVTPSPDELDLAASLTLGKPSRPTPKAPTVQDYEANRARLEAADLKPYAGQYVAFAGDSSRILASNADLAALKRALAMAGIDPSNVVLEYIPEEDTLFGGAELL